MGNRTRTYYTKKTDSYIFLVERYGLRRVVGFISYTTLISIHVGIFGHNFGFLIQRNGGSYDMNLSIWFIYLSISIPHFRRRKQIIQNRRIEKLLNS